ncbi:ISL3 family transposase, partial [Peribacillus cavernae]
EKEESPVTRKAERFRVENEEKRWMRIQKVHSLKSEGYSISAIAKQLHLSRGTIYADLEQSQKPSHKRSSSFDRFHPFIRILLQQNQTGDQIEKA